LQFVLEVDCNARNRSAPVELVEQEFYGRVVQFYALPLASTCPYRIGTSAPETILLAAIETVNWEPETPSFPVRFYRGDRFNTTQIVDVSRIRSLVGRIKDRGLWALIERGDMGLVLDSTHGDFQD
jgi:hypothetical protein